MDNSDFITITLISISIIILLLILILTLFRLHYIQSYKHEYGHVLKLKEMIYKHKKDIEANTISIQVAKFGTWKVKTYSDYFEILENNKQKAEYQIIIKDIAINGYEFSKQIMLYKPFCIVYCIIWLITLIAIICNNCVTINFDLILLHELLFWLAFTIFMYFSLCESGYGPNKSNSKERGDSDHYIYFHPNEFKYITLEEDKKHLKKSIKYY